MERIWMKNWPKGVSTTLQYRLGEKPLHEYVQANAAEFPQKPAYIFYGREITWGNWANRSSALRTISPESVS